MMKKFVPLDGGSIALITYDPESGREDTFIFRVSTREICYLLNRLANGKERDNAGSLGNGEG